MNTLHSTCLPDHITLQESSHAYLLAVLCRTTATDLTRQMPAGWSARQGSPGLPCSAFLLTNVVCWSDLFRLKASWNHPASACHRRSHIQEPCFNVQLLRHVNGSKNGFTNRLTDRLLERSQDKPQTDTHALTVVPTRCTAAVTCPLCNKCCFLLQVGAPFPSSVWQAERGRHLVTASSQGRLGLP